jgi:eukaryotic-like serine/threonine-protein kinase
MQSQDELIGTLVAGRYRVVSRLGQGGMGNVYLAVHEAIEKKIALKVLRLEFSIKPELVTRFQQEAISASRVKHPGVLDVFDFGRLDNGCFFIAMELLQGRDLADELERRHVLDPESAVRIALQVCRALAAAHSQGVVHRDLKPENVYLQDTSDGEVTVKIVDFGIAQLRNNAELAAQQTERRRLTRTGMIFGTPEYMSPEQALGKDVDARADVYAAGIILFEMLTGAVPFTGDSFFGVLNAHLSQPLPAMPSLYPALSISRELEAAISRALAKNPDERYRSMRELAAELSATPEGRRVGALGSVESVPPGPAQAIERSHPTSAQFTETQPEPMAAGNAPSGTPHPIESARRQPARRSLGGVILLGVVVAGATAAATVLLWGRAGPSPALESVASTAAASAEPVAPPASSAAPLTAASAKDAAPVATRVRVSVTTEPAGAVLFKDGFQVCDQTPCNVEVERDSQLSLEAKKGALRGATRVLAQRDQSVRISLSGSGVSRGSSSAKDCWETVETEDGLKLPRRIPCR